MTVCPPAQSLELRYGAGAKAAAKAHSTAPRAQVQSGTAHVDGVPLANYSFIKKIGQGAFSTVHHAIHLPTNREVALKVINKASSSMETILTEIAAMRRLRGHPHIVQLYDVFEDSQYVYMAIEYCGSGNLHEYLVSNGRLSEDHARIWFRQLLSATMWCQAQGVISRDIKNSNIVLDAHGNIKLADFGLAVLVNNANTDPISHSAGSAVFAAPEVYAARRRPYMAIPSDVWAIGAVLHSMVKRVLPFPHLDYARHWSNYTPPEHVSADLQQLLVSIFNLDPRARPTPVEIMHHPWVTGLIISNNNNGNVGGMHQAPHQAVQQARLMPAVHAQTVDYRHHSAAVSAGVHYGDVTTDCGVQQQQQQASPMAAAGA